MDEDVKPVQTTLKEYEEEWLNAARRAWMADVRNEDKFAFITNKQDQHHQEHMDILLEIRDQIRDLCDLLRDRQ